MSVCPYAHQNLFLLRSRESLSLIVYPSAIADANGKFLSGSVTLPCSQLLLQNFPFSSSYSADALLKVDYFTLDMILGRLVLYFNIEISLAFVNLDKSITMSTSRQTSSSTKQVRVTYQYTIFLFLLNYACVFLYRKVIVREPDLFDE